MRYENWKVVFEEQRVPGTLQVWAEPFTRLRVRKLFDLRADSYDRADITSNTYDDWLTSNVYVLVPAQAEVPRFLDTFRECPPRPRAASFSIDQILDKMRQAMEVQSR